MAIRGFQITYEPLDISELRALIEVCKASGIVLYVDGDQMRICPKGVEGPYRISRITARQMIQDFARKANPPRRETSRKEIRLSIRGIA